MQTGSPQTSPLRERLPLIGWTVALAVVLAVVLIAWLSYRQVSLINRTTEVNPDTVGVWQFAQLQRQLLSLQGAVDTAVAARAVHDPEHLRLALALAWSRIDLLMQGVPGEAVAKLPARENTMPRIEMLMEEIDQDFEAFIAAPVVHGPVLQEKLRESVLLSQQVHSFIYNDLLRGEAELTATLKAIQIQTASIDFVFLVLVVLLIFIIWKTLRTRLTEVFGLLGELGKSEERLRHLMEASIQGIIVHRDFNLLYVNDSFVKMLNYGSPEELMGKAHLLELVHPDQREETRGFYQARLAGNPAPSRYERQLVGKHGATLWVELQAQVIDWDDEPAALITCVDITERHTWEENLRKAKEISDAANRAKSNFLASMSHELRTPLTSMIGFAQMILKEIYGVAPPRMRKAVEEIEASGHHLQAVINDVLDISRIEAGRMELRLSENAPRECIEAACRQVSPLAERKRLDLIVENTGEDLPRWVFDFQRIKQVLLNLVGNAIKFSDKGSIRIGSKVDGNELVYWVADEGIGIPEGQLEHLFAEFQQADSSIARNEAGSGLGLAIAKRLVEIHGGRIWVESEVGVGSAFRFALPSR